MLETVDTTKKVDKEAYREWFPRLKADLRELQQAAREAQIPIVVIFEGWHLSGKADSILHITEALDPRGFNVYDTGMPTPQENQRPWFHRFMVRTPARGKFAVFERSWYMRVLAERVEGNLTSHELSHAYQDINRIEQMLVRDGALIVKFFLHISRKEHKRRLDEGEKDPFRELDNSLHNWRSYKKYDEQLAAVEEMLERTSTHFAPWVIVEAGDNRYRRMKVLQVLCEAIVAELNARRARKAPAKPEKKSADSNSRISVPVLEEMPTVLDKVDMNKSLTAEEYDAAKIKLQARLRELQYEMVVHGLPLLIVFEGWDAAGKGGSIRRLTAQLDARFYDVISIAKPTPEELGHHYLWRFWKHIPRKGYMTIFDRSHYGRVTVERIEGFCTEDEWRRAYQEINEFELMLYQAGTGIVKFWLEITPEEQLARFQAREKNPHKAWKLTDEDWRNREKWAEYREAVDDMIKRTSTTYAPWTIIEGNCKRHARVRCMETVIASIENMLKTRKQRK